MQELYQPHVRLLIRPDHLPTVAAPVPEGDGDLGGAADHVLVREDVAAGIDHDPGAFALALVGLRAEEPVVCKRYIKVE